jgi:hypothetical protein
VIDLRTIFGFALRVYPRHIAVDHKDYVG